MRLCICLFVYLCMGHQTCFPLMSCRSVVQLCSTLCDPTRHIRLPCPPLSPGVCPNSCSLYRWSHPAFSSFDALFSFCPQFSPASGTFPLSRLFTSNDKNTGASGSALVLPMDIQGRFPLGLTGLLSLQSKGLSAVFSSTTVWAHQFFGAQPSLWFQLSHPCMITGKTIALTIWVLVDKVISLSRFVITFLPKNNCLLISWL